MAMSHEPCQQLCAKLHGTYGHNDEDKDLVPARIEAIDQETPSVVLLRLSVVSGAVHASSMA